MLDDVAASACEFVRTSKTPGTETAPEMGKSDDARKDRAKIPNGRDSRAMECVPTSGYLQLLYIRRN